MRITPFIDPRARFLAGKFGVGLFLVSLGVLFATSIVGYLVIRVQLGRDWPDDLPSLPALLWLSTGVLVVSSGTMQWALHSVRHDRQRPFRAAMLLTTYLGIAFLLMQTWCWLEWLGPISQRWAASDAHRFALAGFYVLTGLHALHVIGGLIPMVMVTHRAMRDGYSSRFHPGVQFVAMYWHFLDAVWIVLLITLQVAT